MAIPNGNGGYQIGDGNLTEARLIIQSAPTALTAAATLTPAQLANGLITVVLAGGAANITLPTVADLELVVSSAKVNSAFDFTIINTDASAAGTLVVGTGWTIVGAAAVAVTSSGRFRARKTGDGAWTAYRV